jgi:lysozyme
MQTTDRGLLALVRHEGIVPGPYLDVKNVWTFGIGHTAAAGPPDPANLPRGMPSDLDAGIREVFRLFRKDIAVYEAEVRRAVTVPLAPHEFDALVSFHYNTGAIARASLTKLLNAGNRAAAADAFLNWRRPEAIIPRREAERAMFRHGIYSGGPIPVWSVDRSGRVDFSRPIRRLTEAEALDLLRPQPAPPAPPPPPAPLPPPIQQPALKLPPPAPARGWWRRLLDFFTTTIRKD